MPDIAGRTMSSEFPVTQDQPADVIPPQDRGDVTGLDEQDVATSIIQLFRNNIKDKEEYGWTRKRQYDLEAYYMIKSEALRHFPWEGASNSRVPLTPTLLDTGHANIKASMWDDSGKAVKVGGVGVEDIRKAPILENYLNWKVNNEMDMESPMDSNIFRTFLHGTGIVKCMRDPQNNIILQSIDIENFYIPIDASGCTIDDTDNIIQIIPLTYNDLQARRGVYKDIEKIAPGIGINMTFAHDVLTRTRDIAQGVSMDQRRHRDLYYIAESYVTYYPKNAASGPSGPMRALKPIELIVWMSPNGGTVHRMRRNEEMVRPFAEYTAYPYPGRFFGMSLPEKIQGVQEDIDYSNKQNTDALDRAISPAMFVDDTSGFDRQRAQRVPGGIYSKGKAAGAIEWEHQPPVEQGFERKMQDLWGQAERLTGLIDITLGAQTSGRRTLGEQQIRTSRADIRFSTVFDRFEKGWKKTVALIYEYCNRYEDRNKKLRVIGYSDVRSIDELFPADNPTRTGLAIDGKFDFSFGGAAVTERETEKQNKIEFANAMMLNPLVAQNPANLWRVTQLLADAYGQRDLEVTISKPKQVDIYTVQEFIQRVMSGQYDLQIRPGIDTEEYVFEISLFMQTDSYKSLDPQGQQALLDAQRRAYVMSVAERQAMMDLQHVHSSMGAGPGMPGQDAGQQKPGQPGAAIPPVSPPPPQMPPNPQERAA